MYPTSDYQKPPPPLASAPPPPPGNAMYAQALPLNGQLPPLPPFGQYYAAGEPMQSTTAPSPWSTGLYDCGSDVPNCCLTCWCPCITFGQIAEIVDKGSTSCGVHGSLYALITLLTGCGCMYSCMYRSKMRAQYMLPESHCNDCLLHFCCELCALCQEHRELQNRGFDMSIGWEGNMERQNRGVAMPPVVHGGMTR